ncbi:asparagine synthase-related protein [Cytobacillus kochii]
MTAIAGIWSFNEWEIPVHYGDRMLQQFQGFRYDQVQTIRERRLFLSCSLNWITPQSRGEEIPFYNREKGLAIICNSIIDNREDLYQLLNIRKYERYMITDSQLILNAYEKWGEDCPKFLVGDFVFMIWNDKKQTWFGARDFSGTRTLYFTKNALFFSFASTMGALLTLPEVEDTYNENWIAEYLANPLTIESVDLTSTVYQSIYQIPPSHSITITKHHTQIKQYCHLLEEREPLKLKNDEQYIEAFQELFQKVVNSKLRTFKGKGAHLSGGLDSGTVTAFAAKSLQGEPLHTFSYIPIPKFDDWTPKSRQANERPWIEEMLKLYPTLVPHFLSFSDRNAYTEMDEWLNVIESPYKYFDNTYWLRGIYEQASALDIGILLNGQRGNWTISWGPALDYYASLLKKYRLLHFFKETNSYSIALGVNRKKVWSAIINKKIRASHVNRGHPFPQFIHPAFARQTKVYEKLRDNGIDQAGNGLTNAYQVREKQFNDLYYWHTTGVYGAKMALKYGVIPRDPTDDLRVVRFCLSLPEDQFVKNGFNRAFIRRATKGYLPNLNRLNVKSKGVQGADGLLRLLPNWSTFLNEMEKALSDQRIQHFIDVSVIRNHLKRIQQPQANQVFDDDFRIAMRTLILYRFLIKGGETSDKNLANTHFART